MKEIFKILLYALNEEKNKYMTEPAVNETSITIRNSRMAFSDLLWKKRQNGLNGLKKSCLATNGKLA